jgi:hypothetical protein
MIVARRTVLTAVQPVLTGTLDGFLVNSNRLRRQNIVLITNGAIVIGSVA